MSLKSIVHKIAAHTPELPDIPVTKKLTNKKILKESPRTTIEISGKVITKDKQRFFK